MLIAIYNKENFKNTQNPYVLLVGDTLQCSFGDETTHRAPLSAETP